MDIMRKIIGARLVLAGLLLLALCSAVFPVQAWAATQTVSLSIPVVKEVVGDTPSVPAQFSFTLMPDDARNPMPEGSGAQGSFLSIRGAGTVYFGTITYTEPGDYRYTVREVPQSMDGYTMDTAEYAALVQVTTDDKGNLQAVLYANKVGSLVKSDSVKFTNGYTDPDKAAAPKTGDSAGRELLFALVALVAGTVLCLTYRHAKTRKSGGNKR